MNDERRVRLDKLERAKELGMDPYPKQAERSHEVAAVLGDFDALAEKGTAVTIVGRLMVMRVHGGMMFADLQDGSGKMQISFRQDEMGEELFVRFRDLFDAGDFAQVTGVPFVTQRGEKTIAVSAYRMISKALLPLPEKWHGLQDIEMRFRQRELDILTNADVRSRFVLRSKLVSAFRDFLNKADFLEIETPMLQAMPGGANAKPFVTHHNALDIDLYLRIAPELYLKRMLVAGFEKIYEIGRCFRNEGIDHSHNPEFTLLEMYWAYAKKDEYLSFLEKMVADSVQAVLGTTEVEHADGNLSFVAPFPRLTFREAILNACGIDIDGISDIPGLIAEIKAKKVKVDFKGCVGLGEYLDELYKKTARKAIVGPVWVLDYPVEMKPLANRAEDPTKSAAAQLVIHGAEVINAYYHELNDPIDQRSRFDVEAKQAEAGSEVAQPKDEEFLEALEHGMPPAAGMGIGIDRFAAILAGVPSLKEIILYPTLRPKQ